MVNCNKIDEITVELDRHFFGLVPGSIPGGGIVSFDFSGSYTTIRLLLPSHFLANNNTRRSRQWYLINFAEKAHTREEGFFRKFYFKFELTLRAVRQTNKERTNQ